MTLAGWDHGHALERDTGAEAGPPHRRPDPGKRTRTQFLAAHDPRRARPVAVIHDAARAGVTGAGGALPFLDQLAAAFGGAHDLSTIGAHVGGAAADACDALGAEAYATGEQVAFRGAPDLHTAAHEVAHVVQQRAGVELAGGVGETGDPHERQADAVADRVVAGRSAADLLPDAGGAAAAPTVQRRGRPGPPIEIAGVLLTADAGAREFLALEAALRQQPGGDAALARLRLAVGRGVDAVKALFASLMPAWLSLAGLGPMLVTVAGSYLAWVRSSKHDGGDGGDAGDLDRPATLLRAVVVGLGYQEKQIYQDTPGEIDSGGPITIELVTAATEIFGQIHREHPELHVVVTGGNDKFHQAFGKNSHSLGKALDFKILPAEEGDLDAVAAILRARARSFTGVADGTGASTAGGSKVLAYAQDEYRKPSEGSSGHHFHINV